MKLWMIKKKIMKRHYLKKVIYSHLNMEDTTEADYQHTNRVSKDFEIKHLGEYHDLYVRSDTLLFTDAFENLRNMYLEIMSLILQHFCQLLDLSGKNL